jgi:hypothetical protein
MYECLIVIPTYNPGDFIFKNLEIYKQLDKDKYKVLLIDNGTNNQKSINILNKVNEEFTVEKNMFNGGYEPGALLHAVKKYESKYVFLTQDSMELLDLSFLLTPEEDLIKCYLYDDLPARFLSREQISWIAERFEERIYEGLANGKALVSTTFLGSVNAVNQIIKQGTLIESKLPRQKRDQECWERVMGIAFGVNKYRIECTPEAFKKTLMGRE